MGTKYTMGIGGEMSEQVAKRIANVRFTSYHTLFYWRIRKNKDIIFNRRLTRRIWKSQDIINNRFLEESVFAIADGYCVINLTKNIVRGSMYQVVNGKKYNLNEQLGLPENSSLQSLVDA